MKTKSESPVNRTDAHVHAEMPAQPVLVWDAPVRVFHWLMVLCFAGAYLTAESEVWRLAHVTLGYTMAGLVAFRLVWGVAGTRYARFASFVRGPQAVLAYVRSMLRMATAESCTGGLIAAACTAVAGSSDWFERGFVTYSNQAKTDMLGVDPALLQTHGAVSEAVARAMVTGRKLGTPADAIRSAWRVVAVLLLAAVLGFWALQWSSAPTSAGTQSGATAADKTSKIDHNDD